jgi:hypothetical protein
MFSKFLIYLKYQLVMILSILYGLSAILLGTLLLQASNDEFYLDLYHLVSNSGSVLSWDRMQPVKYGTKWVAALWPSHGHLK